MKESTMLKRHRKKDIVITSYSIHYTKLYEFRWNPASLLKPEIVGNLLYLSIGATSICYVIWNWTVKEIGALRASVYIYT